VVQAMSVQFLTPLALAMTVAAGAWTYARPAEPQADRLCQRGYDLTYNLDFPEAIATFQQAITAQPKDPAAYRGVATATWLSILFQRGLVTVDDYEGRVTTADQNVPEPPAPQAGRFRTSIERALALAEEEVRRNPRSASAHYDVATAVGLTASYGATVEGRVIGSLRAARRAYNEQEEALSLDPRRKDAGFIVGTYRYLVATLPLPLRLMAYVVGFGGGRDQGLRMIEEAAAYPGESQMDAKFELVLLYNRERRFDQALRIIRDLQLRFPRNRLLWLEAGATALRDGRTAEAEAELNAGIDRLEHDSRPRAFGEEALWRYKRGAARVRLRNDAGARADLESAVAREGHAWVRGRAHTELGKLADLAGDRARAVSEYRAAVGLGTRGDDAVGIEQAQALMRTPYRSPR
jgi:tetratricopeptide (TPR) repeat protein